MIESMIKNNILISGGGSGGHIFPALAIADKIKEKNQNLFVLSLIEIIWNNLIFNAGL